MRVCWIIGDNFDDHRINVDQLKNIAPIWGSWRTWRSWQTDNVLCQDFSKAQELITRTFQQVCNLYIPEKHYDALGSPNGVNLYGGEFPTEFDHQDQVIAMHLAAGSHDLVLLLGFDLSAKQSEDRWVQHKWNNYLGAVHGTIRQNQSTQWVLIDHPTEMDKRFTELSNLTCDKFQSVLQLLD